MVGTCTPIHAINLIVSATGISFPSLVFIIYVLGGLIWFAKDWKTGIYYGFLVAAIGFVGFYQWGCAEYGLWLSAFLLFFIIMCLTLYSMKQTKSEGGIV